MQLSDGSIIFEQKEVLNHIGKFYSKLFENKDSNVDFEKLNKILKNLNIPKVSCSDLVAPVSVEELGAVLKQCKHNKTPDMDGVTSNFFKVFWLRLKYIITNAINFCFLKGQLSTTLHQWVVVCLPKGNKEKSLIKNWHPLSLLCVVYKFASGQSLID